jgi:hypothetical protein
MKTSPGTGTVGMRKKYERWFVRDKLESAVSREKRPLRRSFHWRKFLFR